MKGPLVNRVWLTRSQEGNEAWAQELKALGVRSESLPCLRFETLTELRAQTQAQLEDSDWIAFSSPRGVSAMAEMELGAMPNQRLASVGSTTAEACRIVFGRVDLVPNGSSEEQSAAGLARLLLAAKGWQTAALVGAQEPRPELAQALTGAGKDVRNCAVYATQSPVSGATAPRIAEGDAVFLASPSALTAVIEQGICLDGARLVSIGPSTSEAIRSAGLPVCAESQTRDLTGMWKALQQVITENA